MEHCLGATLEVPHPGALPPNGRRLLPSRLFRLNTVPVCRSFIPVVLTSKRPTSQVRAWKIRIVCRPSLVSLKTLPRLS